MTTTREASRPLDEAPKDHTMIWLLVDYSSDGANPLENEILGWTIGHNGFDDTGVDEWEFAGWSWEQDCFTQGVGKVVGWHPLQRPDQQLATEPQGYVAGLEDLLRWNVQGGALVSHDEGRLVLYADIVHALSAHPDQPAADTRVVTVDQMQEWRTIIRAEGYDETSEAMWQIICNATTAPSDKIAEAARAAHEALWELNPDNYTHEDVVKLNDASVEAIFLLADAIGETHGKTPEWWEARRRALAGKGE